MQSNNALERAGGHRGPFLAAAGPPLSVSTGLLARMKIITGALVLTVVGCAQTYVHRSVERQASSLSDGLRPCAAETRPIEQTWPSYDRQAIASKQRGWVVVEYDIDAGGKTVNVRLRGSSPPGLFDQGVIEMVRSYRFVANNPRTGCGTQVEFGTFQQNTS
jgi:TonB family protein